MSEGTDCSGMPRAGLYSFEDVIRIRKAERKLQAEEKRQVDLQRIRDMNSNTGIHPIQLCPEEMWRKIFGELDSEDKGNVWSVHPLFREAMEKTHIQDILFPQVLKVKEFQSICGRSFGSNLFHEKLRLISKHCCKSFDRWMEDQLKKRIQEIPATSPNYDDDEDSGIVELDLFKFLRRPEFMKKFLDSYAEDVNPAKRFFPREIILGLEEELDDDFPELIDQFKNEITFLLERFGTEIWHVRLFMAELGDFSSEMYILLHRWISLMPNLKWLELSIPEMTGEKAAVMSALQMYSFPTLPHLERLSLHCRYKPKKRDESYNINAIVLGANQRIKILDLLDIGDISSSVNLSRLAHLTESLQLTGFTVFYDPHDRKLRTLRNIQQVLNYKWPLRTIILSLKAEDQNDSIYSILRFLEKFPTLERVLLERLEGFHITLEENREFLKLPNLLDFEMALLKSTIDYEEDTHFLFSLQFLLNCKKLKRFSWKLSGFDEERFRDRMESLANSHGELLGFRGGLRFLYDSAIWDVFPYLEYVHVDMSKAGSNRSRCEQSYKKTDRGKRVSFVQFLKTHSCYRNSRLGSCVMLKD